MHMEKANMHCQCIACARSFYMGLTSAEGRELVCPKGTTNNIFISTIKIWETSHVGNLSHLGSLSVHYNLYGRRLPINVGKKFVQNNASDNDNIDNFLSTLLVVEEKPHE
jgi:hypothetical protein